MPLHTTRFLPSLQMLLHTIKLSKNSLKFLKHFMVRKMIDRSLVNKIDTHYALDWCPEQGSHGTHYEKCLHTVGT